ncbi:hypothetical protein OPT61_g6145 [Boeremia exigua]|uniref:Uncharacterized protein n=1 Tax=Boeremia exigua TaxID=749465 RepID=A0ACC2I7Q4_9PLEO|nr:hypothetical protein OPT61_g6145 [Boeremia exigua]
MHRKSETASPRSKPSMARFPSLRHSSTHSTLLGDHHKTPAQNDPQNEHHAHQVDYHHVAAFLVSFLSHMFAPVAYQQCTSSAPCWAVPRLHGCAEKSGKTAIIVDDEFVLLEDRESEELDGGPVCREATIESWKVPKKGCRGSGNARRWTDLPYFGAP